MSYISLETARLSLNRETLTPFEIAQVERLLALIEADLIGYCGYNIFEDPSTNKSCVEMIVCNLLQRAFFRVSNQSFGLKSSSFQNVSVVYDLSDDLSAFDKGLLDRYRAICIG